MFALAESDEEDHFDAIVTAILDDGGYTHPQDRDHLRPLLRYALEADWIGTAEDRKAVVYIVLYISNEIDCWWEFVTKDNIKSFFKDTIAFEMAMGAAMLESTWSKPVFKEFLSFLAEQFISIYRKKP
jgi:hypothetical protein